MTNWIKTEDRLPEKDGRYLVFEIYIYGWINVCSFRYGMWDSDRVTHWQQLPESPHDS